MLLLGSTLCLDTSFLGYMPRFSVLVTKHRTRSMGLLAPLVVFYFLCTRSIIFPHSPLASPERNITQETPVLQNLRQRRRYKMLTMLGAKTAMAESYLP